MGNYIFTKPKNTTPDKQIITEAIAFNEGRRSEYNLLEDYYTGNHPILYRIKAQALKNNRLVINHAEYITDLFVGYLVGKPVEYHAQDEDISAIVEQYKKNSIDNLDSEIATDLSIFGRAYELIYSNENLEPKSAKIDPRHCIIVYDDTVEHQKLFAVIYDNADTLKKQYQGVRVVTKDAIYTYSEDLDRIIDYQEHGFGTIPVIEYKNNAQYKGDFKSVIPLINAYNTLQSDRVNDKEQLIEAILILYGMQITPELLAELKEHRVMTAPPKTNGTSAEYLVKQLDENGVELLRKRIEADIHKISKTPNMSDENFAGNVSGVAIKFKLLPFEWASNTKQRYFSNGLRERFNLYNSYLHAIDESISLVPLHKLQIIFKRSLPNNDYETSQMINNLGDFISKKTAISQLSFVTDPASEIEQLEKEKREDLANGNLSFGTITPNIDNLEE